MTLFSPKILLPTFLICLLLAVWELLSIFGLLETNFLPPPSAIGEALYINWKPMLPHIMQTLSETLIGLFLAIVLGLLGAVILSSSSMIRQASYPLLLISQTIPMIVLAPLLLLWFGFGLTPKIIIVVLYCFFPIIIATTDGFINADQNQINLLKAMNATRWQILKHVRLPGVLSSFFSGLKISATYCFTGAIAGEFIGAEKGLGIFMRLAANSHAFALLYAAIFVTVVVSISLFVLTLVLERLIIPWRFKHR
jgi:ABC-type nitrate/sulfonate/bicarbonate transport system permease component